MLALAAWIGGCAAAKPPAPADPGPIRFFARADLPLARAQINGVDVGFMLLDSGSSTSVLDGRVADRLRLPRQGQMPIIGIGGRMMADTCRLNDLWVGGRSLGPRFATIVDLSPLSKNIGWPMAGIVGFDCLRDGVFTVDLVDGSISFPQGAGTTPIANDPSAIPPGAAICELRMVAGLPAVPGVIGGYRNVWLQIDTGSNGSLALPSEAIRRFPDLLAGHANTAGQDTGVAGVGNTIISRAATVGVFGTQLNDVAIQVELPTGSGPLLSDPTRPDLVPIVVGRMGNQVLRQFRITFDLPHHRLWAVRRPLPPGSPAR